MARKTWNDYAWQIYRPDGSTILYLSQIIYDVVKDSSGWKVNKTTPFMYSRFQLLT